MGDTRLRRRAYAKAAAAGIQEYAPTRSAVNAQDAATETPYSPARACTSQRTTTSPMSAVYAHASSAARPADARSIVTKSGASMPAASGHSAGAGG